MIGIAVVNASTVVSDLLLGPVVAALQKQVSGDFCPVWGINAGLRAVGHGQKPEPWEWVLAILDNADIAGALGYHDITTEGLPLGKVFAKTTMDLGGEWTITASHELLEMLADPEINLCVQQGDGFASYEVCDACEDDQFGYAIDGIPVSDFVFPEWFEESRAEGSTQFDFCKHITKPFQLLEGGYTGVWRSGRGWTQLTARFAPNFRARPPVGSRRERRTIPHGERIRSTAI